MFLLLLNTVGFLVSQEYDLTEMQESQEIQGILPTSSAREKAMDEKSQAEFQLEKVGGI